MSRILARQVGKLRENVTVAWTCAPCPSCQSLNWNKRLCVTVRPRVLSSWSAVDLTWYSQKRLSWHLPSLLRTRCALPFQTCSQTRQGSLYGKHSDTGKRSIKSRRRKPSSRRIELKEKDLSSIIKPVDVKPSSSLDGVNIGEELTSPLKKEEVITVLSKFYRRPEVRRAAEENGIDDKLFHEAYVRFRRYCVESEALPVDLHVLFSDLLHDSGHVDDIFPYFLEHAKIIFPHLDCMEDLQQISDLRQPANWYPDARAIKRKLIFHAGPTNSGKTYHALENFMKANSGVYCGPLRLLASEVYHKTNEAGTPCDLITGEERKYVDEEGESSPHSACTVEMVNVNVFFEVAVIDEIQMLRDPARGWAWTRALLGICAEEVHLCGEASAIELVKDLAMTTGDEFEVRNYERLTKLTVQDKAIGSVKNVQAGDCIVCFNKNDIYKVSRQLEKLGYSVAVIYGTLPSGTKLSQARKFNDPEDPCKVMVATDAIGMGLNLSINRIIFYSLMKPFVNEKGEKEIDVIPPHMALQIAGRAGRYGTSFEQGQVTTFKDQDLPILQELLKTGVEPVEKAGLHPTAEQIELFAYHLPKATLSNLVDIFVTLSKVDSDRYFICNSEDFKFLADMIEHIPMLLRSRYVFCCAPISKNQPFACTMFLKYARQYSRGSPVSIEWLHREIGWPFEAPVVIEELVRLECIFDVLDNYLWLGYRFPDIFPNSDIVREMQTVLDKVIQTGVRNITTLLKNSQRVNTAQNPEEELAMSRSTLANKEHGRYPDRPPSEDLDTLEDSGDEASEQTVKLAQNSGLLKHGRLSDKLIQQGILTSEMVEAIKQEMVNEESSDADKDTKV